MATNNLKQADVISGATVLPNANGSAPGQWMSGKYDGRERIIMLLPGPPHELKALFEEQCLARLRAKLPPQFIAYARIENHRARRVVVRRPRRADLQALYGCGDHHPGGSRRNSVASEIASVDRLRRRSRGWIELAEKIEEELGDSVFSDNGDSMEQIVGYYLQMRNATLAVAESCTGGLLAERITSVGGSSRYFLGGAVVYSNQLKTAFADVPAELIEKHGAVSTEVAKALAEGIRRRSGATFGLSVTGVAGPTGGSDAETRGTGFSCARLRRWNRSGGTQISRRSQTHPPVRQPAGAGYGAKKTDVDQSLARRWSLAE